MVVVIDMMDRGAQLKSRKLTCAATVAAIPCDELSFSHLFVAYRIGSNYCYEFCFPLENLAVPFLAFWFATLVTTSGLFSSLLIFVGF